MSCQTLKPLLDLRVQTVRDSEAPPGPEGTDSECYSDYGFSEFSKESLVRGSHHRTAGIRITLHLLMSCLLSVSPCPVWNIGIIFMRSGQCLFCAVSWEEGHRQETAL